MRHKKYTERVEVWLTPEWADRIERVADHPHVLDSISSVVRDCVMQALPTFEGGLGILPEGEETPARGARELDEDDKEKLVPRPGEAGAWGPDRGRG